MKTPRRTRLPRGVNSSINSTTNNYRINHEDQPDGREDSANSPNHNATSEVSWSDLKRLTAGSDTAIFIVANDTDLCNALLRLLREPGALGRVARQRFELGWQIYVKQYAGGAFGILIHPQMQKDPPIIATGSADQAAEIAKVLSLRARDITRRKFTPILVDRIFEDAVRAVTARLSVSEGNA